MNFKYITGIIVGALFFASCDKYLDVEPKGIVIPKRFEEFDGVLNAQVNTDSYPEYFVYASDDIHTTFSTTAQEPKTNAYFWKSLIDVDNESSPAIWGSLYRQIYNANIIINSVMQVTDASEEKKRNLLGEALAERANAHFYLLTAFSKAYDKATANSLPGVPWVTYIDVTTKSPERSTLQATLDLIIADLKTAEGYLGATRLNKARINKAVAQAMLSRVYLYMENYTEAKKYATLALEAPHQFNDYNGIYSAYMLPAQETDPEILFLRASTDYIMNFYINYSNDLINLFEPDDMRMMVHAVDYYGEGWYSREDNGWGMYGIRFVELKMTQAEALVHENDLEGALDIINEIRALRIADYAYEPIVSTDKNEVLELVLSERRKELAFGSARWLDMKRLAKQGLGTKATRQSADMQDILSIDPATYTFTFEIPSSVLMFNPGMPKNF